MTVIVRDWLPVISTLIGGALATSGTLLLEHLRRRRERQNAALSLAGFIQGSQWLIKERNLAVVLTEHLALLRKLDPNLAAPPLKGVIFEHPVIQEFITSLLKSTAGIPGSVSSRAALWFSIFFSVRGDLQNLKNREFDTVREHAAVLEEDLRLWRQAEAIAEELVPQLYRLAGTRQITPLVSPPAGGAGR